MSWIIDIAGKAEDLLNKVDKTAATALQNKSKSVSTSDVFRKSNLLNDNNVASYIGSQNFQSPQSHLIKTSRKDSFPKKSPQRKRNMENDDEQLLQYLNSTSPKVETLKQNSPVKTSPLCVEAKPKTSVMEAPIADIELSSKVEVTSTVGEEMSASLSEPHTVPEVFIPQENSGILDEAEIITVVEKQQIDSDVINDHLLTSENRTTHGAEELLLANKRTEHAESEMKRMQKKLEHWNAQISSNDRSVRELQERENDLIEVLNAKDSQLAVLKVRLEEADQELMNKRISIEDFKAENERLSKSYNEESVAQAQAIDNLKHRLQSTEEELNKSKEACHAAHSERLQCMSKMEEQQQHLVENVRDLQKKKSDLSERNKDLVSRLQIATNSLESMQQEYSDYKQKAQRILQSKEKLISSLKDGSLVAKTDENQGESYALLCAEADGIRQERDLLKEELRQANESLESSRTENQALEKMLQNDTHSAREHCRSLEEQLVQERLIKEEFLAMNNQVKQELHFIQEDLARTKSSLENRIQDREMEIEKLRKQLTTKSMSSVSQEELESRLHALTENLIHKQTVVEALSTEKNSLTLQLERLEQRLKESQLYGSQAHTVVGVNHLESERRSKTVFVDNPLDSNLTRRVKKVYGTIDALSIRIGVFFRRYPAARMFIIVYMLLLHLWVMVVLLTYEPEIHSSSYQASNSIEKL